MQIFPNVLSSIPPLQRLMKKMYHAESLFTNILLEEAMNYIIEQIYIQTNLMPIRLKLIFRRLLIKLAKLKSVL